MTEKITYYGTPETVYDENVDFVKGSSLTGSEVDMNFNTLEGRCIRKVELNGNMLVITSVNGNEVTCSLAGVSAVKSLAFDYDSEHGTLLVFVNGHDHPIPIEGFISKKDFRDFKKLGVLSDDTIRGNGTPMHPLSISRMHRTGMLKAVDAYADELPALADVGERYVTVENVDTYGALYNYRGVLNIIEHLEGTGWHVATKEDWDDMLNAVEPEYADRNHHLTECNVYLGESANYYLTDTANNFNAVLCGFAYNEVSLHVDRIGESTAWWTASHDDDKNAYVKRIDEYADGVYQDIIDGQHFYSVRLVRDIRPDEIIGPEVILGKTYLTTVMPSEKRGLRLWTATNYTSDLTPVTSDETQTTTTTECDGTTITTTTTVTTVIDNMESCIYRPSVYPESEPMHFINEWNGSRWVKQRIDSYDSFYVKSLDGFYYLSENGLVSINDMTPIDMDSIRSQIDALTTLFTVHDDKIERLSTDVGKNITDIENLSGKVHDMDEDLGETYNMAVTAAGQAVIATNEMRDLKPLVEKLASDMEILKSLHINDVVMTYISKAADYRFQSFSYTGSFSVSDGRVYYSISKRRFSDAYADFHNFLYALHDVSWINSISYLGSGDVHQSGGRIFEWNDSVTERGAYIDPVANTDLADKMLSRLDENPSLNADEADVVISGVDVRITITLE